MANAPDHRQPLTPDFYHYAPAPIMRAQISQQGRFVTVHWAGGKVLDCFYLWLQENAIGQGGIDPATREGLIDPADLIIDDVLEMTKVDQVGHLLVQWRSGRTTTYHSGWLRHFADGLHRVDAFVPACTPWTTHELPSPPNHDAIRIMNDPNAMAAWLNDLARYGLTLLRNAPIRKGYLLDLAHEIGPIRDSNFGRLWDVRADVNLAGKADTNSTANTCYRLGPHTDMPTRETPPGFQFLHCMQNEATGGESTMTDSLALIDCLQSKFPEDFQALTSLNWIFFSRGPALDHRWSGPVIDYTGTANTPTIRAFYPVRAFPDINAQDVPRAYHALTRFQLLAADPQLQMRLMLQPGDILCFDNRRILHGREAFASNGARHLQGIYIDRDEVYSRTRVANRQTTLTSVTDGTVLRNRAFEQFGSPQRDNP